MQKEVCVGGGRAEMRITFSVSLLSQYVSFSAYLCVCAVNSQRGRVGLLQITSFCISLVLINWMSLLSWRHCIVGFDA